MTNTRLNKNKDITLSPLLWEHVEASVGQNRSKQVQGVIASQIIGIKFAQLLPNLEIIPKCYRRDVNRAYFDNYIAIAEFLVEYKVVKWVETSLLECIFTVQHKTTQEIRYLALNLMGEGRLLKLFWDRELTESNYNRLESHDLLLNENAGWLGDVAEDFRKDVFEAYTRHAT